MPYTLKTSQISVKDPETGEYSGVDILAEQTEQGLIAELQAEGTTQVDRITKAATDVQAAVDKAEADAAKIISDTQTSVNTLESQKNTIAQTVASMAELGTDTTLSTPGMAADAGAVGDLSRQLSDTKSALDYKASLENKFFLRWTVGKYISYYNGNVVNDSSTTSATLDYLPVKQGDILRLYLHAPGSSDGIAFYNTSKQFVEAIHVRKADAPVIYTVPADGFMRFSNGNSAANILNTDAWVQLVNAEYPSMADVKEDLQKINGELGGIVPPHDDSATYKLGEYAEHNGQIYKAFEPIETAESWSARKWEIGVPTNDILDNQLSIAAIQEELQMPRTRIYASTIVTNNVAVTIANNLKFERGKRYKITYKIATPINAPVYFTLYKDSETQLYSTEIAQGEYSTERTYTVSTSYDITEGELRANGNVANLGVQAIVEPLDPVYSKLDKIIKKPLTTLPDYIVGNLAYKPLGNLEKGYICLVTDDGNAAMNTYTIPMVLAKGVPCTFAIMSTSDVMQSQSDIDIVLNAIANGGCSVAQHGGTYWTNYTEDELNDFFDTEKAFFDSVGITIEGAVLPGNYTNDIVQALAGGRFGIVRQGHDDEQGTLIYYDNYTAGARSNLYNMPAANVVDRTLQGNKDAIDYAIANKKLLTIYWHENELTSSSKEMLEAVIDYAKTTSIEFVTLGDVRKIK